MSALARLAEESSIFRYRVEGDPPSRVLVTFRGLGLARDAGRVALREPHDVEIKLGSSYPRTMPELRWASPIYHPNISEIGLVCLGGYGTHWVPSLKLDALCEMLWDMLRYLNYDVRSPYNREAALWAAHQSTFKFPIDHRPLRDLRVARGRIESTPEPSTVSAVPPAPEPPGYELVDERPARPPTEFDGIEILDEDEPTSTRPSPTVGRADSDVIFID